MHLFFLLLLFYPTSFSARTMPPPPPTTTVTSTANQRNITWSNFKTFLDAGKGSRLNGIHELKNYMQRFGYLKLTDAASNQFNDQLEAAVTLYQRRHGFNATGKLDSNTLAQMSLPRCGVPDTPPLPLPLPRSLPPSLPLPLTRHFNYFKGKPRWSRAMPTTLSYSFSPNCIISNLNLSDLKHTFRRAFSHWSSAIPVNFTETENYAFSDIKIGFYLGDHDDGEPFDGVLGVLAHGFSPESGKLHFDAAETWAVDFETEKSTVAIDLESVATHEIGHVLGLAHSFVKESVMYPSLKPRERKIELKVDDIEGIQRLYGSNPNFDIEDLSDQSDSSTNHGVDSKMEVRLSWWIVVIATVLITCTTV